MQNDDLNELKEQFSMDDLDSWTTTTGLVQSAISFIEENMPQYTAHVFYHQKELHEYREIDREGLASFPDDSLFIGCLSMISESMPIEQVFTDFQINDPLIEHLLRDVYSGRLIIPIVHRFEFLAFIVLCTNAESSGDHLSAGSIDFLRRFTSRLRVNLYAASVADQRQRDLIRIAQFPLELQKRSSLEDVYSGLLEDLLKEIEFDSGVCYAYESAADMLVPFAEYQLGQKAVSLKTGKGISGQVFESGKALFVPDRKKHPSLSLVEEESFIDGSFISVPFGNNKVKLGVITLIRNPKNVLSFGVENRYMLEIAAAFTASEITNRQLFVKLDESNFNVVNSLTKALEAKDSYTEGHSARVTKYSALIAQNLGCSQAKIHQIRYGAMLHDIGKIGISDAIIHKKTSLTDEEFRQIKEHTEIGYNIVNNNPFFSDVKNFIRYHHETINGTGYYGKKIGEYPEEAMIISAADIYDALTSDRPYRKALSTEEALNEMKKQIGVHFTSRIYDALAALFLPACK